MRVESRPAHFHDRESIERVSQYYIPFPGKRFSLCANLLSNYVMYFIIQQNVARTIPSLRTCQTGHILVTLGSIPIGDPPYNARAEAASECSEYRCFSVVYQFRMVLPISRNLTEPGAL